MIIVTIRLDRRPSMVLVSGYPEDVNMEDMVCHFRKFGEILETVTQVNNYIHNEFVLHLNTSDVDVN